MVDLLPENAPMYQVVRDAWRRTAAALAKKLTEASAISPSL